MTDPIAFSVWRRVPRPATTNQTPEQAARDLLERIGVEDAQTFTAGDVVELANLISELRQWRELGAELERLAADIKPNDE